VVSAAPDFYSVSLSNGHSIATGALAGDHLLRVRLSVSRWNREPGRCSLSLMGGGSCDGALRPVKGEVITLHASAGTLSATTVTTDADGRATLELTAPQDEPITLTSEAGLLKTTNVLTLQAPFTQLRFGPVSDTVAGEFVPRKSVYVQFVDPDGRSPEFARDPPAVHFELVGCAATVSLYGNGEGLRDYNAGGPWSSWVAFSFQRPGVGCRWSAFAQGFETVTSEPFSVQ
jgi:hypothetical protein